MKHLGQPQAKDQSRRNDNVMLVIIVVAGICGSLFAGISVYARNKNFLLARAETLAASLPQNEIENLTASKDDIKTNSYNDLKTKLTKVRDVNKDIRFSYLTTSKDGQVVFFVDSESPDSKDYSPPGQTYDEASDRFKQSFNTGEALVEGPYRDRWGNWLSALAPIKDPVSGKVIAVAGIDSSAASNFWQIVLYSLFPLLLASVPFIVLIRERKVKRAAAEIALLKTRFVSVASHELRSPLNGILWAIQTMLKKPANAAQEEMLTDMYISAELSLATVNEILDMSIFERGKGKNIHHDPVDLVSLVSEVLKALKLAAKEKNIKIQVSKDWPPVARVVGDSGALKRAFMNIVSNSIKYSPETSQITIDYRTEKGQHVVSIKDSGIGIPKDELGRVMEGYYRARNTAKVDSHGTGLGLWVSRLIVQEHKGKIWIESAENVGTTVHIALPILAIDPTNKL